MQRCAFTPYEGKKPYIFVSYAHKDSDRVFPILEELDRRGYRVWYDDGIAPGSEWPENIAQHLDGCSLTLAFISPNSIASANCRREVTFALSKRKPFLGIILEKTEMSLGMEMQLSAQQCIMKYTYTSDGAFFQKICSCPDMEPCLGQPKAAPDPVTVGTPAVAAPEKKPVTPVESAAPATPAAAGKPLNGKLIGIIAGAVAVVVLALVLLLSGGGGNDNPSLEKDPSDDPIPSDTQSTDPENTDPEDDAEGETGEWELYYNDQVITAQDIAYISRQKELVRLEITNCIIQKGVMDQLKLAETVDTVILENCSGPVNLTCMAELHNLVEFKVVNCDAQQSGLASLTAEGLETVDVSGNPGITDLSIFTGCPNIRYIYFNNTGVTSLAPLAAMSKLYIIEGSNSQVSDLTPICGLTELHDLKMANCKITELEDPLYAIRLDAVDLSGNGLVDIDFLEYCTVLRYVDLSYNELCFASVLEKSKDYLLELDLSGNSGIYSHNLTFLNKCKDLEKLCLDGLYLTNLNVISELENLEYLSAVDCSIHDISGLRKLENLGYLNLSFNDIYDISVLAENQSYYLKLDLSFNNRLEDVSALNVNSIFTVLNLTNSNLDPYKVPLLGGNNLLINYHAAWEDPNCMNEENRTIFGHVDVVDCPMDKIVAMEKRFGEHRIKFLQDEMAYLDRLEELEIDCTYLRHTMQEA